MAIQIVRHRPDQADSWDRFVAESRNGVFLFRRSYMDYHADRFTDHSLIALDEGEPIAVFPANLSGDVLWSHEGLSYGGWVVSGRVGEVDMLRVIDAQLAYLRGGKVAAKVLYKAMPHIYAQQPAEDDLHALFRHGAILVRRDISAVINLDHPIANDTNRHNNIKKARKIGVVVRQSDDFEAYHRLLVGALEAHQTRPTHTLDELTLLATRHPENIRLYAAEVEGDMTAGALVFDTGRVIHTQYLASSPEGRRNGSLPLVIEHLKEQFSGVRKYLSLGISTEDAGRVLNEGLSAWKEGLGGRGVVHDFYEMQV